MKYLKKIENEKIVVREKPYVIVSNKDLMQLKEILKILNKDVKMESCIAVPESTFKELEKANKLYKNLLLKRNRSEKLLKSAKSGFASLEDDIKEYAPEFHSKISGLIDEMNVVPLNDHNLKNFKLFSGLNKKLVTLTEQIKETIEDVKKEGLGKYVYCLIPSVESVNFGKIGLFEKDVYSTPFGGLSAIVSDLPIKDYRGLDFEENVNIHNKVIQNVMKEFTVIPLAFNQVWRNREMLEAFIKTAKKDMQQAFKKLEGKLEFGIKISKPNGFSYEENGLIEDLKNIRSCAESVKVGKKFKSDIILNAYYLISKDKKDDVSALVKDMESKYKGLKINFTGPWPPYNFVEIKVGGENVHSG